MIGDVFEYKKATKVRKYKIVENTNEGGGCRGCAFINSHHCERAKVSCSKVTMEDVDTIVVEIK